MQTNQRQEDSRATRDFSDVQPVHKFLDFKVAILFTSNNSKMVQDRATLTTGRLIGDIASKEDKMKIDSASV